MGGNGIPMMVPQVRGQQVDIKEATLKNCEQCEGVYFDKAFRVGVISRVAPGNKTGQDVRAEFSVLLCRNCGHEFGVTAAPKLVDN